MSSRRPRDFFRKRLDVLKASSRHLQLTPCQDVFKMSFKNVFKASSRRPEDVLKTSSRFQDVLQRCLQDVF